MASRRGCAVETGLLGRWHAQLEPDCKKDVSRTKLIPKKRETMSRKVRPLKLRYENHINTDTAKIDWTLEEELMLIQYHNEIGNKWALIAQKIPGKSDNSVKNHFYSKLRKVLRKLNTIVHSYLRREFREININVIYKIVEAC